MTKVAEGQKFEKPLLDTNDGEFKPNSHLMHMQCEILYTRIHIASSDVIIIIVYVYAMPLNHRYSF